MKANEFVKKFGWDEAKECIANTPEDWDYAYVVIESKEIQRYMPSYGDYCSLANLKRLVESWELVDSMGGLEKAKTRCYPAKHLIMDSYHRLKQAIADVESCQ